MARIILFLAVVILTAPVAAENARIPDGSGVAHQTSNSPPAVAKGTPQLLGQPADGFWALWKRYDGPIRTAFLVIAGVAGFRFAYWRARIAERQANTAERGHALDRFSTAVDQLMNEHLPARLGGIDALWRIGPDSPKEQQETIMGILCAFLREPPHWSSTDQARSDQRPPVVRSDVQAILDLIGARAAWCRRDLPEYIVDISDANLVGARLRDTRFEGAYFNGADLAYADLTDANLMDVKLLGTNLYGADLPGADLTDAKLSDANLAGADFTDANLTGADFERAKHLNKSQLEYACVKKGGEPPSLPKGVNPPTKICPEDTED